MYLVRIFYCLLRHRRFGGINYSQRKHPIQQKYDPRP